MPILAPPIAMPSKENAFRSRLRELLATLVGMTPDKPRTIAQGPSTLEEVLIDTEVDGARYLLIRMPSASLEAVHLTPREREIVRMVAAGHPNKVIADVLSISSWTVCTHLRRIFAKLCVGSRAAMVAKVAGAGSLAAAHVTSVPAHAMNASPVVRVR